MAEDEREAEIFEKTIISSGYQVPTRAGWLRSSEGQLEILEDPIGRYMSSDW